MKATYRLEVKASDPPLELPSGRRLTPWESGDVRLEVDHDPASEQLTAVRIIISGADVRVEPATGSILSSYPELEAKAFSVASYVANVLQIETGLDTIDPRDVIGRSPDIEPETADEESLFNGRSRTLSTSVRISFAVKALLKPCRWDRWGLQLLEEPSRKAAASFADGLRVSSPFLRYEQFWKVVEHFFPALEGKKLDAAVALHVSSYDSTVTASVMKDLREVRIRCIHSTPRYAGTHLSPGEIGDLTEVEQALPRLETVARLLIAHPPRV